MLSCKANEENRATHFWCSVMLGAAVLFMELSICLPLMWLNESARKGFKRIYIGGKIFRSLLRWLWCKYMLHKLK